MGPSPQLFLLSPPTNQLNPAHKCVAGWGEQQGYVKLETGGQGRGAKEGLIYIYIYLYTTKTPPKVGYRAKECTGYLSINDSSNLTFKPLPPPLPPPPPKSPRQASIYIYASRYLLGRGGAFPAALRFYATPTGEKKTKERAQKKKAAFIRTKKGGFFFLLACWAT